MHAAEMAEAGARGDLTALWLLGVDPLRDLPYRARWEQALERASTVVAHASFLTEGIREHANVVFPFEAYAEKDGTLTHPDGRLQRLRPAIGHQGAGRYGFQVLDDLARRLGLDLRVLTSGMALAQLIAAVPFYAGLTLDEIGGRGMRWQEREAAAAYPSSAEPPAPCAHRRPPTAAARGCGWAPSARSGPRPRSSTRRRCRSWRRASAPRWRPTTPTASACATAPRSWCPTTAARSTPPSCCATRCPAGTIFLQDGLDGPDSANVLTGSVVEVRRRVDPAGAVRRRLLLRALVDADPQGAVHLPRRLQLRADHADGRAQAAGPLPGSLRTQPRRPVRLDAADRRHRQAAGQAAVRPAPLAAASSTSWRRSCR